MKPDIQDGQQSAPQTLQEAELELERLRVKKLELQEKAARDRQKAEKHSADIRQQKYTQQLRREVARRGITWYPNDEELQRFIERKYKANFLIRDDGQFSVEVDGKKTEISSLLERLAIDCPFLADQATMAHLTTPPQQLTKSDLKTTAQKAAWIASHSLAEYEALPLRREERNEDAVTMTAEDWKRLPLSRKSELLSKYGEAWLSEVLKRRNR